jgi:dipeptidase D
MTDFGEIESVIEFFKELSEIPRPSGREGKVCVWLKNFAQSHGFEISELSAGEAPNILIKVPASTGFEQSRCVCLQAHMDMVCQKKPQSTHNFDTDPIRLIFEGDWISADETTLGADNGIGMAMAMAAALTDNHGPLELLFTVDEEGGLGGATELPENIIRSEYLLNLDSEDDGFIIGCAGGQRFEISSECRTENVSGDCDSYKITIDGLIGGHSGVDIDKHRSNAVKVCGRLLDMLNSKHGILISSLKGGTQTTAIARDIEAVIVSPASLQDIRKTADEICDILKSENPKDSGLSITVSKYNADKVSSGEDSAAIITLLNSLDCGPVGYCKDFPHIVETSASIGIVRFDAATEGTFMLAGSERSSQIAGLEMVSQRNSDVAAYLGMSYKACGKYLPWEPDPESQLLKICDETYRKLFDKEPVIEIVHAGLECSVIGEKYPEMEMVSFGPLIENAHSPQERVSIESIRTNYRLLIGILDALK